MTTLTSPHFNIFCHFTKDEKPDFSDFFCVFNLLERKYQILPAEIKIHRYQSPYLIPMRISLSVLPNIKRERRTEKTSSPPNTIIIFHRWWKKFLHALELSRKRAPASRIHTPSLKIAIASGENTPTPYPSTVTKIWYNIWKTKNPQIIIAIPG